MKVSQIILYLLGCKNFNYYQNRCFQLIYEDIMKRPDLYQNHYKIILLIFFHFNFVHIETNDKFLALFHEEIKKNESLDGLNYMMLYLCLGKTEHELKNIHNYIEEFQKYSKNQEKKIRNLEKFKFILYYLQNEYPNDEIIVNFVEKNKNVLSLSCSNHYKICLNVKPNLKKFFIF